MGLLDRLLRKSVDDHAEVRPLWHAIVALARTPRWYSELGLADTVPGRFDAVALVMALVLLRTLLLVLLRVLVLVVLAKLGELPLLLALGELALIPVMLALALSMLLSWRPTMLQRPEHQSPAPPPPPPPPSPPPPPPPPSLLLFPHR